MNETIHVILPEGKVPGLRARGGYVVGKAYRVNRTEAERLIEHHGFEPASDKSRRKLAGDRASGSKRSKSGGAGAVTGAASADDTSASAGSSSQE